MDKLASEYKVLIVDDVPTNVMLVQAILKKEGYTLLTCDSGTKALRIANEKHPNLILLDIMMPEMSGLDVCREIRKTSRVPVIMLTAKGEEIDRILGLELGADDYIVKPFSPREVVARIKAVLRRTTEQQQSHDESSRNFATTARHTMPMHSMQRAMRWLSMENKKKTERL